MSMNFDSVIEGYGIEKRFKGFNLDIPQFQIPKGFATALIGENGAGKTTLLNILSGMRLDYKGKVQYFDEKIADVELAKERIGYTGSAGNYFLPNWTTKQVREISEMLFDGFDKQRFDRICEELGILKAGTNKKVSTLSDGNKVKLMLATVLARNTECLLLDEPASPLDPLMRDRLCEIIREYIAAGDGEHSVFFSTHNISDMENVTDYCMIMGQGRILEQGFVEELKEKYVLVKGENKDAEAARKVLYTFTGNAYGYEGICLADRLDRLAGMDITLETPSLFQISVAVMKANSTLGYK